MPGGKVQTAVRGRDPRFTVMMRGWRRSEALRAGTFLLLRSSLRRSVRIAGCPRVATYRAVFMSWGLGGIRYVISFEFCQ